MCAGEENILINLRAEAPGPAYVAFSPPPHPPGIPTQFLTFFIELRERLGVRSLKHMD